MMLQALTLIWGCMERKSGGSQKKHRDVFRKFVQKIFVFIQKNNPDMQRFPEKDADASFSTCRRKCIQQLKRIFIYVAS